MLMDLLRRRCLGEDDVDRHLRDAHRLAAEHLRVWRLPRVEEARRARRRRLHDETAIVEGTDTVGIGGSEDGDGARANADES